jgi:hypothetical protein
VAAVQVILGKLGSDPAPGKAEPGAQHRDRRARAPKGKEQVRGDRNRRERRKDDRQHEDVRVDARARRRAQRDPHDREDDRGHRDVLAPAGALVKHAFGREHEHEQSGSKCRLDDDQRGKDQREHLQGPTEHREADSKQPARAPHEPAQERRAQVVAGGGVAGLGRLKGDA